MGHPPTPASNFVARTSSLAGRVVFLLSALLVAAVAGSAVAGFLVGRTIAGCDGPGCPDRPTSVGAPDPWVSPRLGFEVDATSYRCVDIVRVVARNETSIRWTVDISSIRTARDIPVREWPMLLVGEPAGGRSAQQILDEVQRGQFPGARPAYEVPGLQIGYQLGAGRVYDLLSTTPTGGTVLTRPIVVAAVRGDLAIWLVAIGPRDETRRGHPSPARTPVALCVDALLNSVRWPEAGDP